MLTRRHGRNNYFKDYYLTTGYKLLNLEPSKDRIAVSYVFSIIDCRRIEETWSKLKEIASNKGNAIIIGPELSQLERHQLIFPENTILIGVDGASYAFFLETGRMPDIVVSDLDGPLKMYSIIQEMGRYIVIHAHGDNIYRIAYLNSLLRYAKTVITTQTEDYVCIKNVGGFTDGDRAILLALTLGFNRIIVCCFSENPIFTHKEVTVSWSKETKRIKIRILYELLEKIKKVYGDRVKIIS
ncbi:MAG: DUF115 domain-containing protein [Desulfurococcales archaeon]|nr:DUF115 domain-containing protein [Desulfurococcales archaeon]